MNACIRYLSPGGAASGGEAGKGHAGKENDEKRNVPEDGPSGENTVNDGERGGGLWTSGGHVSSGTPYNDEYGRPQPDRDATPEEGTTD